MRLITIPSTLLLSILTFVPVLAAGELPFGQSKVREAVLSGLSDMAGRDLEVSGDIDVQLAWSPTVRLEGIRIANAQWGRAPYLLTMDALEVQLDMRALLRGRVHVPRLQMINPVLHLEVSEQGDANWILGGPRQTIVESSAAPEGELGNLPRIDRLGVTDGELAYLDHRTTATDWTRGSLDAIGGSLDGDGVDVAVRGSLGDETFTLVLRTASLDALHAGRSPTPLLLSATAGAGRLMVQGTVVAPFALHGLDLKIEASAPGFDELPLVTGWPDGPPFELRGRLRREQAAWHLQQLVAEIGRSRMTGQLALDLSGPRPHVDVDLETETLDLTQLLPKPDAQAVDGAAAGDASALLDHFSGIDGTLNYAANRILTEGPTINDLAVEAELDDGRMRLGPVRLSVRYPAQQTRFDLRLDATDRAGRDGLTGLADGRLRGEPISAVLQTDAWLDLTGEGPSAGWQLRLSPAGSELKIAGDLLDLLSPRTLSVSVDAKGATLAGLSPLLGVPLPQTQPYQVDMHVSSNGGRYVLDDVNIGIGQSDIDGRIAIDTDNVPTAVNADLVSDRMDLDDLMALAAPIAPERSGRVFSDQPLGLEALGRQVQGTLNYRARELVTAQIPLSTVELEARLRDRHLSLEPVRIGIGGGTVEFDLGIDTGAAPPQADLDGEIRQVNLRQALAAYSIADQSLGTLGGEMRLWMQGDTPAALAGSSDGGLFLLMTGGEFEQLLVEAAGLDPGEATLALLDRAGVPIDCAYLNLRLREGQGKVEPLAVDTRDTLFVGGGSIDLERQALDLMIEARPKDASLLTFSAPIRLKGPLTNPELMPVSAELVGRALAAIGLAAVQPLAGLLPLLETGGEAATPYCDGLIGRLQEAR